MADEEPIVDRIASRVRFATRLLAFRRQRSRFLPRLELADPVWDILLDLYVATRGNHRIGVSSLCVAAGVPQTTALRWIKLLTDRGLIQRTDDDADRRRVNVALSREAVIAMDSCLDAGMMTLKDFR